MRRSTQRVRTFVSTESHAPRAPSGQFLCALRAFVFLFRNQGSARNPKWNRPGHQERQVNPDGAQGPAISQDNKLSVTHWVKIGECPESCPAWRLGVLAVSMSESGFRELDTSLQAPGIRLARRALDCGSLLPLWMARACSCGILQFLNPEANFREPKRKQACALQKRTLRPARL